MSLPLFLRFARAALLLAIALVAPVSHAQETSSAGKPEAVIREFYAWYVKAVAANRDPFKDDSTQLKRYATARLIREVDKARKSGELGSDPFIQAQDVDKDWAKNIKIAEPKISGETATVKVELKGAEMGTHKLNVTMRNEAGTWKVDKVDMP
jgi:ABC-type transporter MlaC component